MLKPMNLVNLLNQKILLLDGAMGTLLQQRGWDVARPERLNEERPEAIADVHLAYLKAGADIITTNTFSANSVALSEEGNADKAYEWALAGAQIAKNVAQEWQAQKGKPCFVAGSMGPTSHSLTLADDSSRISFDKLAAAYAQQAEALIKGGVDVLLIETAFDTLNVKAAWVGAYAAMRAVQVEVPLWISITLNDASGRMLAGQTLEDFYNVVESIGPLIVSINCGGGAAMLAPFVERLSKIAACHVGVYPNAGLPNEWGAYEQTPQDMTRELFPLLKSGQLNVVGGCCGTTERHIEALRICIDSEDVRRRTVPHLDSKKENFIVVGERCNVLGSRAFARLIEQGEYESALVIARKQVAQGAEVIDINLDAPMINAKSEMQKLLRLLPAELLLVGRQLMIDSSDWEVVSVALRSAQNKMIVNSLSLKEGESLSLERAKEVLDFGADLVVMAADEEGQATTYERRMQVCRRAYDLLTQRLDFPPQRIIFDPNMLAVCTGVEEHSRYAMDFLKATRSLRSEMPHVGIIAGVSNLSFSFRGANAFREAMHAVFLDYAREAGMNMAIVNPAAALTGSDVEPELRHLFNILFQEGKDLTAELSVWAERMKMSSPIAVAKEQAKPTMEVGAELRLIRAVMTGDSSTIQMDVKELLLQMSPIDIVSGPLMSAMESVGKKFGAGEMYLPQVVKSAQTMKQIVSLLEPAMEAAATTQRQAPTALLATVEGDVHDIGKNICATVLRCNGFNIVDMGVMVKTQAIVEEAKRLKPQIIGLSGLITPSLAHMSAISAALEAEGITTPLFIGGATTSAVHTALFIAPQYSSPVVWTNDASQFALAALRIINENECQSFVDQLNREQSLLREQKTTEQRMVSLSEARKHKLQLNFC